MILLLFCMWILCAAFGAAPQEGRMWCWFGVGALLAFALDQVMLGRFVANMRERFRRDWLPRTETPEQAYARWLREQRRTHERRNKQ